MPDSEGYRSGRHFLQIPGPTNVPERVLRAMSRATEDHRGPELAQLDPAGPAPAPEQCSGPGDPVLLYPSSGTGAWEAALVNILSPGDRVLMFETGHFAVLWSQLAGRLGLEVELVPGDWRRGVDPAAVESRLSRDDSHRDPRRGPRAQRDFHGSRQRRGGGPPVPWTAAGHPALLLVDTISSLGSIDYRHDEWGVDVTIAASQKGLMLPPGLGLNALSEKALAAAEQARSPRSYWDWKPALKENAKGFFPYTPASNLLYGLDVALDMLLEEGLENVFARHSRLAEATRRAVRGWGLVLQALDPGEYSDSLTAVRVPSGHDADRLRKLILERFDMSLGTGLGKVRKRVFRIGHLGDFNELMLAGTLCGVEMGLDLAGIPHRAEGVGAALKYLARTP